MKFSGRHLSRAWLAVSGASSDDDGRPQLFRAVRVEQHHNGIRLIATDSYWLAHCWVPAERLMDDLGHTDPDYAELPATAVTIIDDEWRVRDLMKFIAKATRKPDAEDITVTIDISATTYDESAPTLAPEPAAKRVRVDTGDERLMAKVFDSPEWVDWRTLVLAFHATEPSGATVTTMSVWMLTKLGKVAATGLCTGVRIDWLDERRARWAGHDIAAVLDQIADDIEGATP